MLLRQYEKFGICKEKYGIPTLLIGSYKVEERFSSLISTFDSEDELKIKLKDWIRNSRYIEFREAAHSRLEKINEENTRTNLVSQIEKNID